MQSSRPGTQSRLPVGDTTPACYPDVRMGPIVWAVMCAHRLDAPAGMGWHTHDAEDIVEQWVLENATATVARLLDEWTDLDVQPHSTRTEQKTHEKLLDEYRTEPDPTEQSTLVTDGGQQMARPRTIYCRECNSIHPADAAHKPWGVTDE
jgi:hypothetical protein